MTATLWLDTENDQALSLGGTIHLYKTFQEMALLDGPGFEVRWPELFGVPYQVEDGDDADPDWMRDVVSQADRFLVKHAGTLSGYSAGVLKVLVTRGREYLAKRKASLFGPAPTATYNEGVVGAFLLDDEPAPNAEDGQANRPFAAAGADDLDPVARAVNNIFCPTGQGGGIDPTCKAGADKGMGPGAGAGASGGAALPRPPQPGWDRQEQPNGVTVDTKTGGTRTRLTSDKGEAEVWQGAGDKQWRMKHGGDVQVVGSKEEGLARANQLLATRTPPTAPATAPPPRPAPTPAPSPAPSSPQPAAAQPTPKNLPKTNDLSPDETKTALARLAQLPKDRESEYGKAYNTDSVRVEALGMKTGEFRPEFSQVASPAGEKKGRLGNVPLEGVKTSQDAIAAEGLAAYAQRQPDPKKDGWPEVAKYPDGTYQIISGHTRLGAVALAGRTHGRAKVYTFDENGQLVGNEGVDYPGPTGNAADPNTAPNLLDIWEDADAWWWPEVVDRLKQRALAFVAGDYYGQPGVVEEGRDRLEGFDNLMLDLGRVIDESLSDPDVRDGTIEMLVDAYLDGATLAYWDAGPDGKGSKTSVRGRAEAQEFVNRLVTNARTPDRDVWGQFMSAKAKEMSDRLAAGWRVQAGAVSQGIANVVTRGIAAGKSADEISADILAFSADVPRARADTIARTEVTRAAAEGQLDAYGRLGVSEISVDRAFELRTQGKNSCPECVALEKLGPMPVEKARGLIPVHPQCKCRWRVVAVPAAVTNADPLVVEAALNVFCPTGKGGGIDPTCGKGGVTRKQSAAAYVAARTILDHAGRQPLTPHQALALTKQMGKLTTAQLRQLKADYGVRSGGGTKAEMATRLRGKILNKLDEARDTGPKPQPPKPAPKTEPAKKTDSTPPPQPSKAKLPHPELDPDRPGIMAGGPRRDAYGLSHEQAKALKDNRDLMQGNWVSADRLKASGVPQDRLDYMHGNKDLERQEAGGQAFYRLSIAGRGTVNRAYNTSNPGPQEVRGPRTRKELDNLVDRFAGMSDVDRLRVQKHLGMGDGRALGAGEFKAIVETRVASNLNLVPISERLKNSPHAEVTRKIAELGDRVEKAQARRNELAQRERQLAAEYGQVIKEIGKLDKKAVATKDKDERKKLSDEADKLQARVNEIQREVRAIRNERQAINPEAEATRAAHEMIHQALNKPNSYKIDETTLPPPVGLPNTNLQTPTKAVSDARAFLDGKVTPRPGDPPMEPVAVVRVGPPGTRAVYYNDSKAIHMDHFTSPSVVAHEYGHHVEYRTPGSREAAQEFLKYRVGNEEVKYYKDVCPTCGYGADEKGAKDQFDKAFDGQSAYYVGKHYDHGATEIVSMGVQKMVEDPVKFAKNDPEYFNFVMGVLSGEHRNNTLPEG